MRAEARTAADAAARTAVETANSTETHFLKARESLDTNVKRLIGELEALQRSSTISEQRLVAELVGVRAEHEAASMASAEAAARRESRLSDQHVTAQNDVAAAEEEVRQERGARRASEAALRSRALDADDAKCAVEQALEVENHRIAAETHRTARLTAAVEDLRSQLESVRASLTKTEVALREATYRVNAHAVRTDAAEVGGVKSQFRFTQVYSKR